MVTFVFPFAVCCLSLEMLRDPSALAQLSALVIVFVTYIYIYTYVIYLYMYIYIYADTTLYIYTLYMIYIINNIM